MSLVVCMLDIDMNFKINFKKNPFRNAECQTIEQAKSYGYHSKVPIITTASHKFCDIFRHFFSTIRPNKKKCMFRIMGLKILGRVGTYIF